MRRQAMLQAARTVFAEKSYAAATVEEIAERAQFGKGTLYLYFRGGKQEILAAILDEAMSHLQALTGRLAEAGGADGPRRALEAFFEEMLGYMLEHRDVFMVLAKEAHRLEFAGPAAVDVDTGLDGLVAPLVQFFREAAEAGALHTADPRALAYTLLYGARGYLSMVFAPPDGSHDNAPEAARRGAALLAALCFDGFGR